MRYEPRREYVWSDAIAYSVGLMASDGCLSNDGRHLTLVSVDIEQLVNFRDAIKRQINIRPHNNGKKMDKFIRQAAFRVQFGDVAYYDFLLAVGLTPNKSKTIGRLNIPERFYRHFLRGVFDGDGSTYGYYDPRWASSFMYYVQYASASSKFLEYLKDMNTSLFRVGGSSINPSKGANIVSYAKADSIRLYWAMYEGVETMFLTRKKLKLESFIKEDNGGIIPFMRAW